VTVAASTEGRRRPRVVLISLDAVDGAMAGLAIRYAELARALSAHADVTLAGAGGAGPPGSDVPYVSFRHHDPVALREPIAKADAVIAQPQWPTLTRWIAQSGARVIYDLYDPETLETLELFGRRPPSARAFMVALTLDRLHDALATGNHFVCASEKQRDLWLGAMLALGFVDARRYDTDPTFRSVIDVVPYGVPTQTAARRSGAPSLRDRFPDLPDDAEVVLWPGGLWKWLDAPTAIHAVHELAQRRPQVRLVFMGASKAAAAREASQEAHEVARACGALGRTVLFNDTWVPYDERVNWLLDAACAISTHRDHLETRFAFRTRLLDCFWSGLPVVCTRGDDLAQRVEHDDLGAVVAARDVPATAAALEGVLDRGRAGYGPQLAAAAAAHTWPRVAEPLVDWITRAEPPPEPAAPRGSWGAHLRKLAYRGGRKALDRAAIGRAPGG
jgi:glycosyltransferase involved in cell wall biosynthesis